MEVLRTERLVLRHFEHDDLDALAAILSHPEVMRYSLRGPSNRNDTAAAIRHYRQAYATRGFGRNAVIERASGELVGFCGIGMMTVDGVDQPELGYRLRRVSWGRGYATEAARACRDHAFGDLAIERLIAVIEPANVASVRVAEKIGFRLDRETELEGVAVAIYAHDRTA